ncbi:YdaS family helix-turn-helix protein [Sphingomonas sp. IC4-52]|uniref:YdaS family helix-turn-helix protein n=1 Tax=Sphingomonas sp. IC4-52 TaxID=2887202 RepID=UPI001D1302BC|nr:YdaS family helix-turn-helix protein [Sphingomonas sp. IC4-52]MCC2978885.1 helix-turn-helix domain-containing protein [Sphingomonas sp. IC4-52]
MDQAPASEPMDALRRAVDLKGSQSALAREIGFTQGSVWRWLNGTQVPAEAAIAIEKATGIRKTEIRPDLFGPEPTDNTDPPPPFPDLLPRTVVPAPGADAAFTNPNGLEPSGSDPTQAEKVA